MNPEQSYILNGLISQLEANRLQTDSLLSQVDANHPDAGRISSAVKLLNQAIISLRGIQFGLESQTRYDD